MWVSSGLALGLLIVAGLALAQRSAESSSALKTGTSNLAAYRFYLQGRQRMEARTPAAFTAAVSDFRDAILGDPEFARAYAGLADALSLMGYYRFRAAREAFEDARAAAERSLKLNDTLAEAHTALAGLLAYHDWDWAGAEREYRRAIELDPSFAPSRHWLSNILGLLGRHDEAIVEAQRAVDLEPISLITLTGALGHAYLAAGRYDEAGAQFRAAIALNPEFGNAHYSMSQLHWRLGQLHDARQAMQTAASLADNPNWSARVAALEAALGNTSVARSMLESLERQPDRLTPLSRATVYAQLGDEERALTILEAAADARDPELPALKIEVALTPIRHHPRFQALLRRMNLF